VAAMNEDNLKLLSKYRMLCRNKGLTKETIKAFECDLKLFFRYIGDKSIETITHRDIEEFIMKD